MARSVVTVLLASLLLPLYPLQAAGPASLVADVNTVEVPFGFGGTKFWVFYGALSSVQYILTVTDTETGQVKKYDNPSGRLGSLADTGAF